MATEGDVFQLETEGEALSSEATDPGSGSGTITPSRPKSEVDLCRKTVPVLEVEEDVCPICLDEYTEEDPLIATVCAHGFHLQCVMSWAQRSRECPLCFHQLKLQDAGLNELLPFGEYVSPHQAAAAASMDESWDLERLLVQLASANQRHERRAAREAARQRRRQAAAATSGGGMGGEASAPQPIRHAHSDAAAAAAHRHSEGASGSGAANGVHHHYHLREQQEGHGAATVPHSPATPGQGFPASWPPAGSRTLAARAAAGDEGPSSSSGGGGGGSGRHQGALISPGGLKAASQSIRKGFAALKIRESFSKTEAKLKSMFSHSDRDRRPDRPADGS